MLSDESKKINLIDIFLIISRNKKKTILLPIALTLVFFFLLTFYQQNYSDSNYSEASINILIKDNEHYLQRELLEFLNTHLASSKNYETWSEQDQKNSLLLGQTEATSISRILNPKVENPFQKIKFSFSTNEKLNAITSFLDYTVSALDKNLAKKIQRIEIIEINKLKESEIETEINKLKAFEYDTLTLNSSLKELEITNNYLQSKTIYLKKYLENNSNTDSSVELSLMDTEILILKNNEFILELEKQILEKNKILREISLEKNKKLSKISSEYKKNISTNVLNKKIISIGKLTIIKIKPISYSLAINLMILFFVFLMTTFISISFIMIKKEYDIRKESS